MRKINRRVAVAAAGAVAVAAGLTAVYAGPVSAAPRQAAAAQTEYFTIGTAQHTGRDSGSQTFVAHGAFAGGGRDDASHNNYDILHFGNGTLRVTHPQKSAKFTYHVNPKTCYGLITLSGPYTISNGTGHYRGISGHGTYKGSGQFIAKRTSTGKCNTNSVPRDEIFVVHGSGPINF